jgi:hypothetical protein
MTLMQPPDVIAVAARLRECIETIENDRNEGEMIHGEPV